MKKFVPILAVVLSLCMLQSCTKYTWMSTSERVVGIWEVTDASKRPNLSFISTDMTANFKYFTYEFLSSGEVISKTTHNNQTHIGKWYVEERTYWANDVMHTEYLLNFDALMPNGTPPRVEQMQWILNSVTGKSMKAQESVGNNTWKYTLSRKS